MAVNYLLLKEEEKEIMNEFLDFYDKTLKIVRGLLEYISQEDGEEVKLSDNAYEDVSEKIKKNEFLSQDLLSNCIWLIQKNEPRASHLRFIIAIIYSIKNLNSVSSYVAKIAKWCNKKKIKSKLLTIIIDSLKSSLLISEKIYNCIYNNNLSELKESLKTDSEQYHIAIKNSIRLISNENGNKWILSNNELIDYIFIIERIERIVDMQDHIISDFSYINDYR